MRITDNNTLYFTDDQATSIWGDNWAEDLSNIGGSMFFDGIDFYPRVSTSKFYSLELEPVYEDTDLEQIFS